MPCYKEYRAKDVGRKGHHYVKLGLTKSGKWKSLGLKKYKVK